MFPILKKEFAQFFNNLTGYVAIGIFLLLNGLLLFVFSSYNILDYGYATLDNFFTLAPFVLLLLIPAITMRLFPEEWKTGTIELLKTRPLTPAQIVGGKFLAAWLVAMLALIPTLVYPFTLSMLAAEGSSLDGGGITGSYIGLLLLCLGFTAISTCLSSFTTNSIVAFLVSAASCFLLYQGFDAISSLPLFRSGADFYMQQLGMREHYRSLSRGVIDSRDVVYFLGLVLFFFVLTMQRLRQKS